MCYVILYENLQNDTAKVSSEGYSTLDMAQIFCRKRIGEGGIEQHNGFVFYDRTNTHRYTITEIQVV